MTVHLPVLSAPIQEHLFEPILKRAQEHLDRKFFYLDCTLGGGGHFDLFLKNHIPSNLTLIGLDQDASAVRAAQKRFEAEIRSGRVEIQQGPFGEIKELIEKKLNEKSNGTSAHLIGFLADLGYSSDQLEDAQRGLSFLRDGPLDMRLNPEKGIPCSMVLETIHPDDFADILYRFADERHSRRIARRLSEAQVKGTTPKTTQELSRLVVSALPGHAKHGKIHAATRTFQALRIYINGELDQLDALLKHGIINSGNQQLSQSGQWSQLYQLYSGGRVAVISFHSIEDRMVKNEFRNLTQKGFKLVNKKPIEADEAEVKENPRARSAKLRILEKVEAVQ
jgi:16S rRNA (cytosine1402-N4)-methyltransferase